MDTRSLSRHARQLLDRGHHEEASQIYRDLCTETHAPSRQYNEWLEGLAMALSKTGLTSPRHATAAAMVHFYLGHFEATLGLVSEAPAVPIVSEANRERLAPEAVDRTAPMGRHHWVEKRGPDGSSFSLDFGASAEPLLRARAMEGRGDYADAARVYRDLGRLVLAAIAYEAGADDDRGADPAHSVELRTQARECWQRLAAKARTEAPLYEQALVWFNLGTCCLRLADSSGHEQLVTAQRLLEEAADGFETSGQRERAFDCYQILLEMGRRSGSFENLAEGHLNCIRILKEDGLKFYALQYYESFLREAVARDELQAAALLYREAASYCLNTGMLYDRHYLEASADTWLTSAHRRSQTGRDIELAENALLAAVDCYNALGDYAAVGLAYAQLADLSLPPRKQRRYALVAQRYRGIARQARSSKPVPHYFKQSESYPAIWYNDLIEWEDAGEITAVCVAVTGDTRYPDVVRRRALNLMLGGLCGDEPASQLARVAESLGDMQIYAVLGPLEHLFDRRDEEVQIGVMRALRFLFFKRSFGLLRKGLDSPHNQVRKGALEALRRLHFGHAFDPLLRLFRESGDAEVRLAALESIGRIQSLEAADFLLDTLRHEAAPLRHAAKRLLSSLQDREQIATLRQQCELEPEPLRSELRQILSQAATGVPVGL